MPPLKPLTPRPQTNARPVTHEHSPECAQHTWSALFKQGVKTMQRGHYHLASRFFKAAVEAALYLLECNTTPIHPQTSLDCLVSASQQWVDCLLWLDQTEQAQLQQARLQALLWDICNNHHAADWERQRARDYLVAV